MKESELQQILKHVETALEIFQAHAGALMVGEIRTRSLLMVVRAEVEEHLRRARTTTGSER